MKIISYFLLALFPATTAISQNLYFPPLTGNNWATTDPSELGWCQDKIQDLYDFLETENTRAFLLLKDGKIVLEKYMNGHGPDSLWYWASAGKSVCAVLTGIAQEEGLLNIDNPTSDYLGQGWTSLPADKENLITVRHQLTMTTGLDDGTGDLDCIEPNCLTYLADAGTRWSYHNAPYTLVSNVVEEASGQTYNAFYNSRLSSKTGMGGLWLNVGSNRILFSKARAMARFGLLVQNAGKWNNTTVLADADYLAAMTNSSQNLNPAYGYLWWLNGKDFYKLPGLQINFPGFLCPDAPADMFAAMGKNGQIINVVPSLGLVLVRMGDLPDGLFVPNFFNNDIWKYVNELDCLPNAVGEPSALQARLYPNPFQDIIKLDLPIRSNDVEIVLFDALGRTVARARNVDELSVGGLPAGVYFYHLKTQEGEQRGILWKE